MGLAVITVSSGGLPVVEAAGGLPVTEATNQFGLAVTKVVGKPGLPVVFVGGAAPLTPAAFDPATISNVTLSNGNRTATNTTGASNNCGARLAPAAFRTSGKYYFEATVATVVGGTQNGAGIALSTVTYTDMASITSNFDKVAFPSGTLWQNGNATAIVLGALTAGAICGMAVDLDNRKMWFRIAPAGNWNASGTDNPATNTGGITIPAGSMSPICNFGGGGSAANNVTTANFGTSAFSGAVPSGFTAGWPA